MERMGDRGAMWIHLVLVVILGDLVISAAKDQGRQFQISFHKDCSQPTLITCPLDLPEIARRTRKPPITPGLAISLLHQGDMVGNITWRTRGRVKDSIHHFYLKLTLSVQGTTADVKCLNVSLSQNPAPDNCMLMVPNNSAQLTMDVILPHDRSCDCDITNMATTARLSRRCRICRGANPVVASVNVATGERSCLKHRRRHKHEENDVKMRLSVWEVTPDVLKFELFSEVVNPFVKAELFVHPDNVYNPTPVLHLYTEPDKHGYIYFSSPSQQSDEKIFYAKLCLWCTDDDESYQCYITDSVESVVVKPYTHAKHSMGEDPNGSVSEDPVPFHVSGEEMPVEEGPSSGPHVHHLILGALAGSVLVACLVTMVVWARVRIIHKYTHGRGRCCNRQTSMENNLMMRESLSSSSPTSELYTDKSGSTDHSSMVLYHPDSPSHQKDVSRFVGHLTSHHLHVDGLPDSQRFENWRDFAEKAGDKYPNIIIVYSSDLHRLLTLYGEGGSCGIGDSRAVWECLLRERNQEYIPCVVLTKLQYLYQHGHTSFCIHFVIFKEEDRSQLSELISKHFSFLRGNNFKIYSLPFCDKNMPDQSNNDLKELTQHLLSVYCTAV